MNKKDLLQTVGILVFILLLTVASSFISRAINGGKKEDNTPTARSVVTCPPDFASYNVLASDPQHVARLISKRKYMHAENGEFINSHIVVTKSETATSKVACGYLFVQAGTANGALQSTWEDVDIAPSSFGDPNGFGGHLDKNSAISVNDSDLNSQYLFALNKIQYWPRANRKDERTADWAALLNVSETVPFKIALNTEAKSGFIDNVSIAYKCWDPQTGVENDGCRLNIQTNPDTTQPLQ